MKKNKLVTVLFKMLSQENDVTQQWSDMSLCHFHTVRVQTFKLVDCDGFNDKILVFFDEFMQITIRQMITTGFLSPFILSRRVNEI